MCALQFSINLCRLRLCTHTHTHTQSSPGSPVHCFKKCQPPYLGRKALRIGKRRAISEEHTPLARLQQLSVVFNVCVSVSVCVAVCVCGVLCVSVRQSGDSVSALSSLKTHIRTGQRDSRAGRQPTYASRPVANGPPSWVSTRYTSIHRYIYSCIYHLY